MVFQNWYFTQYPFNNQNHLRKCLRNYSLYHYSLKNYSVTGPLLPLLYLQLVSTNHKEDIHGQDPGRDVDEHAGKVEADEGQQDVDQSQHEPDPTPDDPRLHQTDSLLENGFLKVKDQFLTKKTFSPPF